MDIQIEECLTSLHSRHINGIFAENCGDARQKVLNLIPKDTVVGIGDSTTIRQLGVPIILKERGTNVLDPFNPKDKYIPEHHEGLMKEAAICGVFLTGTNAITLDGKLVNVDAVGNRVAGMFWGHPVSIIVVGRNKIVKDLDEAFHRIRNIIAPNHIRIRSVELGGREFKTPCVANGECSDCRARDRLCNIFTIIESKPLWIDLSVIIVNEDLGLSWDTSWPQDRIKKIIQNYKNFAWVSRRK
jgi:hypothetical protein